MTDQKKELKLTTEEASKSYAKYFYQNPTDPSEKCVAAMDKPMSTSQVLPIENINDLLNPGYFEVESGWCIMENGSGYVANHTVMPGVTVDMINWWFAWHSLEDLRYKIWWPEGHFGISISDEDRAKVLDPSREITKKFQGLTHHVIEDTGGPSVEKIEIHFKGPEELGFDMDRFKSPAVGTLISANGESMMLDPPPGIPNHKSPAVMMHFIRETEEGIEFRSRFWMGYHIIDKKPQLLLPPGVKIPEMIPKGLALHNVYEYANLASFLPQIYQEQNGEIS